MTKSKTVTDRRSGLLGRAEHSDGPETRIRKAFKSSNSQPPLLSDRASLFAWLRSQLLSAKPLRVSKVLRNAAHCILDDLTTTGQVQVDTVDIQHVLHELLDDQGRKGVRCSGALLHFAKEFYGNPRYEPYSLEEAIRIAFDALDLTSKFVRERSDYIESTKRFRALYGFKFRVPVSDCEEAVFFNW